MLDFQITQYPFRLGLAEGVEPHQAPPGTLITAENVCWRKSGKAEKRYGTTQIASSILGGGSISAAVRLFTRGTELCLVNGTSLYAYSPTLTSWKTVGKVPNVGLTWTTAIDTTNGVSAYDSALSSGGLRVDAWVSGTPGGALGTEVLFVQVIDASDGTVLLPAQRVASTVSAGVRVVILDTTAILVTSTGSGVNITAYTVSLTAFTVSSATNLRTDGNALATGFDACVIGSTFVIAYTNSAPALKLYSYDSSLVQQATGGITSEALGALNISIDGASGETLYVLYARVASAGTSLVKIATANPSTLAEVVAPVTVENPGSGRTVWQVGVCRYDSSNCIAAYSVLGAGGVATKTVTYKISSAAVVDTTSERGTYGTFVLCRPFMLGGSCWMMLSETPGFSTVTGCNSCLVEVETSAKTTSYSPHRYVGLVDPLIGGSANASGSQPVPNVITASASSAYVPVAYQSTTSLVAIRQGVRMVNVTLSTSRPADLWRSAASGQETFVSGGVLSSYDGRFLFDYGFLRAPSFSSLTVAGAGGTLAVGTYLYGLVLEYRSSTGLLYRSPTQTSGTATSAAATSKVTAVAFAYNLGNKQTISTLFGSSVAIPTLQALYRTLVGGTTYQRRTAEPNTLATLVDQTTESNSTQDTQGDSAAGLASRPAIYTTGGILDDYTPPASVTQFHHADRIFVLAGDQMTWWYSKAFQDDLGTAPGFHPNFRITFDETQTAGATMDDKAIFFSATGVRYMLGTGPAANGANSDFTVPTVIQSDVGCTSARSVVGMPDGLMFLSDRGIYLLTRGLELVWIGRPVKDTLATYPTVTSAVLVAKQNQVRFTCTTTDGTSGVTLVYDYVEKQWATLKHWVGGVYGGAIADACMWNGAWTFVSAAGIVYSETTASYLDASGSYYVPMTLETAWINATGPLSFVSVRNLALQGISNTDHDLTIQVGFDNTASYQQTATFLAESPVTTVGPLEECTVSIGTRRKCSAIRFKIADATPTTGTIGTGQGPSFDMMGLEVGVKRGLKTTSADKRA